MERPLSQADYWGDETARGAGRLWSALNEAKGTLSTAGLCRRLECSFTELTVWARALNQAAQLSTGRELLQAVKKGAAPLALTQALEGSSVKEQKLALSAHCDLISGPALYQALRGRGRLTLMAYTDSTNSALERCLDNAASGDVMIAELQSAARGRRGSSWQVSLGSQLTFSLVWHFASAEHLLGLPLVSALAAVSALEPLQLPFKIKWPNDIYLADGKLCGILVELRRDKQGREWAIIGLGLNVYADQALSAALKQRQISFLGREGHTAFTRTELAARLINTLRASLTEFERCGFAPFADKWAHCDYLYGREVCLELDSGSRVRGRCAGIDDKGQLLLDGARGQRAFATGHVVSSRLHED